MPRPLEMPEVIVVTGGAGFVGANLVPHLLTTGATVVVADNFCRGAQSNLSAVLDHPRVVIVDVDLSRREACRSVFSTAVSRGSLRSVWHLAANSDIPAGVEDPDIDLRDTFGTTYEVLRAMKEHGAREFMFASSSAIYGDLGTTPLHENIGPLLPISNYGAMKLASEAQAAAAAESYLDRVFLYRFPNVVGVPATHGVILDFVRKLKATPDRLEVLGDGTQQKAYLHVTDLVDAMLVARERLPEHGVKVLNIGPVDDGVTVRWIAEKVVARVAPGASVVFGRGSKGWTGDVPRFTYRTERLRALGWSPRLSSERAIERAVDEIASQEGC